MRSENVSTDQGMTHTPKLGKQDLSIETSAHALTKRSQSVFRSSLTPQSLTRHQGLLSTPTTAHDEKKYSDIKDYYSEITNTNMDIIKQLKDDLADANAENQKT